MLLEFGVFFLSMIYWATLGLVMKYANQIFWLEIGFSLVALIGIRIIAKRWKYFILPLFIIFGSVFLLFLIDSVAEERTFAVLSAGIFYLTVLASYRLGKYDKDQTAKAMHNLAVFATVFCWYSAAYGWYLNLEVPVWILMAIVALVTFAVSYLSFVINQLAISRNQRFLYSLFLAYLMAETVFVQNSWPFRYLTTGVVALIIYFASWDVIRNYFLDKLNPRKVIFNAVFLSVAVALILLSSKWYPVV